MTAIFIIIGLRLSTFSGGERQRLKLTRELRSGNNIIVPDEPGTGLHPSDTERLMTILNKLVAHGNTLIVIVHNLYIISQADWIIDIGAGAGKYGGELVSTGTVVKLLKDKIPATARYLNRHLEVDIL